VIGAGYGRTGTSSLRAALVKVKLQDIRVFLATRAIAGS
jgi:hypothetical protein